MECKALRTACAIIASALVLAAAPRAFAWGPDGHRIACAIAWAELKSAARTKVESLLGIAGRDQFAETCLWADHYRDAHPETASWHSIFVAPDATLVRLAKDCREPESCVLAQINLDISILDGGPPGSDQAGALKFLSHFVADVHQPLHVGRAGDGGGRAIKGKFFGRDITLFAVWEEGIIAEANRPWRETANALAGAVTDEQRLTWTGARPINWADESLAFTHDSWTGYSNTKAFNFGPEFEHRALPVVYDRLTRAGVRLGHLLNQLLADGH